MTHSPGQRWNVRKTLWRSTMKEISEMQENLELVSITYNVKAVFDKESSRLTSRAYDELKRVARMVGLLPYMAVNVEVCFDGLSVDGKCQPLWRQRSRAIQDALVKIGVDASRIHTNAETASQTLDSEITLSLITMNGSTPVLQTDSPCHHGWGYEFQAY